MRARSAAVTMPRVASTSRMCSEMTSHSSKNASLLRRDGVAVGARAARAMLRAPRPARSCRTPCRSPRPRCRSGRSRRCRASCRAAWCRRRSATCPPCSDAICCGIWRIAASTRPQVSSAVAYDGVSGVLARRHDHAEPRAGVDVDVRIDAALADQPQLGQPLEQRRADLRALADQHQRLGVVQALGQRVDVLDVVVPDRDVVARELARSSASVRSVS